MYSEENREGIYVEKQFRIPSFTMSYAHQHNYYEFFYLRTGSCIYSVNNQLYHLSAGDIFIIYPGDSHYTQYEGLVTCERVIVCIPPSVISENRLTNHEELIRNLSHSGKVILSKKGRKRMEDLLERMLEENNLAGPYSTEFLFLETLALLMTLLRDGIFVYDPMKPESISSDIEEVLHFIAENYKLPLTLEEVAAQINLTSSYFSHKFKKVTGTTFKEYLTYIRIRQSCQMLLTTDDSITEIAINCGFNSSNYYKDCFRRIYGISPRAFRKNGQSQGHTFEFRIQNPYPLTIQTMSEGKE